MRDWRVYVRAHLRVSGLTPEREARIVRELAAQLEDFYRDARARGADERDADAHAREQIIDWDRLAHDVLRADRPHQRPAIERLTIRIEDSPGTKAGGLMFAHLVRDVRYAIRQLRKTPAFTLVAVLTLALGIGATSAIFSVVNGVLLRPLPYPSPASLVRVHELVPQYGRFSVAPATFFDWRQQATSFERIAAYTTTSGTFVDAEGPERVQGTSVTWDLFELLGVAPEIGTGFTSARDAPGANNVILLSYSLWQRRFGGDPEIVGRAISVNGGPATILGVMPPDFYFPSRTSEFWQPLALNPTNASRGAHYLGVIARMNTGTGLGAASAEMKAISERLAREYPEAAANESAEVVLMHEQIVGAVRPALLTLLAAVGVLVLIACANVANLLLVRASVREKEVAIRTALGAARGRLALQMLAESGVLAIAGGSLGLLLAFLAIPWILRMGGDSIPRAGDIGLDLNVLAFTFAASILTGVFFGLAPAWQAARTGARDVLKEGGRSSSSGGARWVRSGLLVVEVALSLILLVGAMLFLRSFVRLTGVDPGFQVENVLAFQVSLPQSSYASDAQRITFFDTLLDQLDVQPAIRTTGMTQRLPLVGNYVLSFAVQGRPPAKPGEEPSANHRVTSPDYFKALGIPLRRGRFFTAQDAEKAKLVAIIDESFARRHFPGEDPIGRGLDIGNGTDGACEIVGIVGDVHSSGLDAVPAPTMYVPYKQDVFSTMWVVARTDGDPTRVAGAVRQVLRDIDPALPAYSVRTLTTVLSDSVRDRRFSMLLLSLFALIAVFLAAVGLYGVVAYTVGQRTREIGLRLAIGAQRGDIVRMIVGGGMKLAIVGIVIGLAGAIMLAGYVESMLFEIDALDAPSYGATAMLLLAITMLACYVPARRATRVDPIVTLQSE